MTPDVKWLFKPFNELNAVELYPLLKLRQDVFIVEQRCAYADLDDADYHCWHLTGSLHGKAVACSRIVPPGIKYEEASIGRVATHSSVRMTGMGKELMRRSIAHCNDLFYRPAIRIGAQKYLKKFYEGFGFTDVGQEYIEDDIPHLIMFRQPADI